MPVDHRRLEPIYTSPQVRALETAAQSRNPSPSLMQRAGLAAADLAGTLLGVSSRPTLVIAGPGNNGGDAFEVAAHLRRRFHRVELVFFGDQSRLSADAAAALAAWKECGGQCLGELPETSAGRRYGLIVDGLFGIGLTRTLEGRHAGAVEWINAAGAPVLALDVPSGINADTGAVMGCAVRATHTVTFMAHKPGLLTLDGPDHCGELHVASLGLDVEALVEPTGRLLSAAVMRDALQPRPRNFHKGNAGDVVILGGAAGMVGAALLAGRAALACGAGRVYAGLLDAAIPVDPMQPELMLRAAREAPLESGVIAAGPGMGRSAAARDLLAQALRVERPVVLDADALNLIAQSEELAEATRSRHAATLMTPHPAEAGRLLGRPTAAVQADRLAASLEIAARYHACVALKGNGTVVADPDGRWWINPTGHPGMASAGMGDALTGIAASLLAQGAPAATALCAAVWLHGAAGDAVAGAGGPLGTTASDVIIEARRLLNAARA
jgi:hydroxyethylthiazole kinase-like uncharacterized protein yjeF